MVAVVVGTVAPILTSFVFPTICWMVALDVAVKSLFDARLESVQWIGVLDCEGVTLGCCW